MHLRPPVEMARCRLIAQLHEWINTVTGLPRIQSSRYQVTRWLKGRLPVYSSRILALLSHAPPPSPRALLLFYSFPILSPSLFLFPLFPSLFLSSSPHLLSSYLLSSPPPLLPTSSPPLFPFSFHLSPSLPPLFLFPSSVLPPN